MNDGNVSESRDLAAGDFSAWLAGMQGAIGGEGESDVPCGRCTACCTSSQFVHIGPEETDTLAHIPSELLFPAPLRPSGHVVLGYDERGHCPMLIDGRCSIYAHRPNTCRTYDCRVFPAAGTSAGGDKVEIVRQARRWQFSYASDVGRNEHDAVRAAATFLHEHATLLPEVVASMNETQLTALAIEIHGVFLQRDEGTGKTTVVDPAPDAVRAEVRRRLGAGTPDEAASAPER